MLCSGSCYYQNRYCRLSYKSILMTLPVIRRASLFSNKLSSRSNIASQHFPVTHTLSSTFPTSAELLFKINMDLTRSSYGLITLFLLVQAVFGSINGKNKTTSTITPGCKRFPWHVKAFMNCYDAFMDNYEAFQEADSIQVMWLFTLPSILILNIFIF